MEWLGLKRGPWPTAYMYFNLKKILFCLFLLFCRSACIFEKMLQHSMDICTCVPWNMPFATQTDLPMCDYLGAHCFETVGSCLCSQFMLVLSNSKLLKINLITSLNMAWVKKLFVHFCNHLHIFRWWMTWSFWQTKIARKIVIWSNFPFVKSQSLLNQIYSVHFRRAST
jgi:hypothetical protein